MSSDHDRAQTRREEIANSVSHGAGLLLALIGAPYLITHAQRQAGIWFAVGTILFAASVIVLYLASALYHALPPGKAKRIFRVIEHSAIFLLIAGTYSPFTLGVLRGAWGWSLFGVVWGLALAGSILTAIVKRLPPFFSIGLYILMGWIIVVAIRPMVAEVPMPGLLLLLAGGLSYTIGVAFYATDARLRFGHLIWHLFVIAGTVCHYFAVLWYAA